MSKEYIPVQYALNLSSYLQSLMYYLFISMQPVYLQLLCMHDLYVVHVAAGACMPRELGLSLHYQGGSVVHNSKFAPENCKQLAR